MNIFKSLNVCLLAIFILAFSGFNPCSCEDFNTSHPTAGIDDPNISIFVGAIKTAGLGDIFVGTGPFTAFVPTNAAFEKTDKKKWEELLKPEKRDQLTTFILHHIVHGKYLSKHLKTVKTVKPLDGEELKVTVVDGTITINKSKIIKADLVGPNGVVHEIDTLLVEP